MANQDIRKQIDEMLEAASEGAKALITFAMENKMRTTDGALAALYMVDWILKQPYVTDESRYIIKSTILEMAENISVNVEHKETAH